MYFANPLNIGIRVASLSEHKCFIHLLWSHVALYFHPVVVHKDVSLCGRTSGVLHHVWQQLPNLRRRPHAKGSFPLFCAPGRWDRVGILGTVEAPGLSDTQERLGAGKRKEPWTQTNEGHYHRTYKWLRKFGKIMESHLCLAQLAQKLKWPTLLLQLSDCLSRSHCWLIIGSQPIFSKLMRCSLNLNE